MKTTIEIKSIFGKVLFTYTNENATIKDAVEQATKEKVILNGASLNGANLDGANLYGASLYRASLYGANLDGASLDGANLDGANLDGASLYGANKLPIYCKWSHGITDYNLIHIGCEKRNIQDWDDFFNSDKELETKRGTKEFKQIQAVYESYKAYLNFLNNENN